MNETHGPSPVVAGVDGSESANRAAMWAADEAVSRGVPLRLVYVTKAIHESSEEYTEEVHQAKAALRAAQMAVESARQSVDIETRIVTGPPGAALVSESRDAALICVGSVGIGRYARAILGSTTTELAENASCPVMIVRLLDAESADEISWIVVATNDASDNGDVIDHAMREARLRRAPLLLLGNQTEGTTTQSDLVREVQRWKQRYPDVHIYPVANRADVGHFMRKHNEPIRLAVIGAPDAGELADIVGPYGHPLFHHSESSVLVVRS